MVYEKPLIGVFVNLRSVKESDAEFILQMRLDEKLNKYLNPTPPGIENQKEWIRSQQSRKGDFYFIVNDNKSGNSIALASIYDIEGSNAEFGRWISRGNAVQNIETVLLLHDFAFNVLKMETVSTHVVKENKSVINFWKRFGAEYLEDVASERFILSHSIIHKDVYNTVIRPKQQKLLRMMENKG